jgi:hypothetical protein
LNFESSVAGKAGMHSHASASVRLIYGKEDIVHARKMRLSVLSETVGLTNGG